MRRGVRRSAGSRVVRGRFASLAEADERLLSDLDRESSAAAERAGSWLKCAPGCGDCCHGPFPVTRLDRWRLRRGLDVLAARDPERARVLRRRAEQAVAALTPGYPGEPATGRLTRDEERLDRFFEIHATMACPVLDPRTGRCELYEARPVACRTYGPPLRFGAIDSPPCELCFHGADTSTVDRCRIESRSDEVEAQAENLLEPTAGGRWETLIAFAVLDR
jgi:Fe-S-cluster containining protein